MLGPMFRSSIAVLAACGSLACGSSGDGGTGSSTAGLDTCGLRTRVTGAVSASFTGQDDAACLTQHSFDDGLGVDFIHTSADLSLGLAIATVTEGETGEDYEAEVSVTDDDAGRFQSGDCAVAITEHQLVETEDSVPGELRHYQVSGEGACTSALVSASGDSEATLADFAFRARFTWRD
jgi:hypothetical protein